MHPCGNADTARFGKGFEPSCDIDAITEDVPFLDHYVAHVDANAELNALVRRHRCIALGHARLQLGRPPQGIDHTAELNQQAITRLVGSISSARIALSAERVPPSSAPISRE